MEKSWIDTKEVSHLGELTMNIFNFMVICLGQFGQPEIADRMLGEMSGGFFIEAGAADGMRFSNTLLLEMKRNWTGLLVEPSPALFKSLLLRNR